MDNVLQESLEKVKQLCEKGFIDDALPVLDRLMEICPGAADDLLYEKAVIEFQCGRAKDALFDFLKHYSNTQSDEVLSIILSYGKVSEKELSERFIRNKSLLKDYPYVYGEVPSESEAKILWRDEECAVIYDTLERRIHTFVYPSEDSNSYSEDSVILVNVLAHYMTGWYAKACAESWSVAGRVIPVYVYYRRCCFDALLQCIDLEDLLALKKLVFIIGKESLSAFFQGDMVWFPSHAIGDSDDGDTSIVKEELIKQAAYKDHQRDQLFLELSEYYENNGEEIIERIREKKPRVMIMTSLFTTALQYHCDFCSKNLEKLGIETVVIKEERLIDQLRYDYIFKRMSEFKPDVVFQLDHFRFESPFQIKNLVYISWIQDYLEYNMTEENFKKLTNKDVLMIQTQAKEILDLVKERDYIDAPAPADETVYKPYELSPEEREIFECDICMVCHASDLEAPTKELIRLFKRRGHDDAETVISGLTQDYYLRVYNDEGMFFNRDEFKSFIKNYLKNRSKEWHDEAVENILAVEMYHRIGGPAFRQAIADWLIEAGYTNMHLWGNGWMNNSKYKEYAKGPAENGEVLSKINQAAKIVIGNNPALTGATRLYETMLSGGLYLCNYVPPENDICDMRKIYKEDEYVMFHNKQELLDQVQYYLTHEDERQEMIRRGREATIERMTYKQLMKKMLDEVPRILERQGAFAGGGE